MKLKIILLIFVCLSLAACSPAEPVEVTRVVTEQVEVTRIVESTVEVTTEVEVTREVEVEVTREVVVEVVVEPSATPTLASPSDVDPSLAFSANFLGELEQDGVKVEFARVLFTQRDALKPGLDMDGEERFDGHEHIGEIIWRITNNTDQSIQWSYDDIDIRINDRQIDLYDWLFYTFGTTPTDAIFPESTIIGGVWFGMGEIAPDDITEAALLMGSPNNSDTFRDVTGDFIITGPLPAPHGWEDLPDELK